MTPRDPVSWSSCQVRVTHFRRLIRYTQKRGKLACPSSAQVASATDGTRVRTGYAHTRAIRHVRADRGRRWEIVIVVWKLRGNKQSRCARLKNWAKCIIINNPRLYPIPGLNATIFSVVFKLIFQNSNSNFQNYGKSIYSFSSRIYNYNPKHYTERKI